MEHDRGGGVGAGTRVEDDIIDEFFSLFPLPPTATHTCWPMRSAPHTMPGLRDMKREGVRLLVVHIDQQVSPRSIFLKAPQDVFGGDTVVVVVVAEVDVVVVVVVVFVVVVVVGGAGGDGGEVEVLTHTFRPT